MYSRLKGGTKFSLQFQLEVCCGRGCTVKTESNCMASGWGGTAVSGPSSETVASPSSGTRTAPLLGPVAASGGTLKTHFQLRKT